MKCLELAIKPDCDLIDIGHARLLLVNQYLRLTMLASILDKEYSHDIFKSFCKPNDSQINVKMISRCYE